MIPTIRLSLLLAASLSWCAGPLVSAEIIPPANLFRDQQFLRDFVGSYGFLSDVEPKVSSAEQSLLATVRGSFEQGKFAEAERQLTDFIRQVEKPSDPATPVAEISPAMVFVLGNLYFQADRPDEARRAFQEAIRRFPRFRRAHTNLAYLHVSQNRLDEALPMLQKSIELGETSPRVFGLLGYVHLSRKNSLAAENAYRYAMLTDPQSKDWKIGLAQALTAQEKHAEAASLLGSLIEENPNDRQLWLLQTNAWMAMERKDRAILNLETLRVKGIADEANLNLLGNLHLDAGEPQLALLAYLAATEKAQSLDVNRALKCARILNDYGFPEKAATLVQAIRTKLGANPPADVATSLLLTEVRISQQLGNSNETSRLLAKLLELNPANPEVLLETARHKDNLAREETDDAARANLVAEARTHYQLAAKHDATAYAANLALGQLLVRERRYPDALTHLQAALQLKKSDNLEQYVSRVRRAADRQEDKLKK